MLEEKDFGSMYAMWKRGFRTILLDNFEDKKTVWVNKSVEVLKAFLTIDNDTVTVPNFSKDNDNGRYIFEVKTRFPELKSLLDKGALVLHGYIGLSVDLDYCTIYLTYQVVVNFNDSSIYLEKVVQRTVLYTNGYMKFAMTTKEEKEILNYVFPMVVNKFHKYTEGCKSQAKDRLADILLLAQNEYDSRPYDEYGEEVYEPKDPAIDGIYDKAFYRNNLRGYEK